MATHLKTAAKKPRRRPGNKREKASIRRMDVIIYVCGAVAAIAAIAISVALYYHYMSVANWVFCAFLVALCIGLSATIQKSIWTAALVSQVPAQTTTAAPPAETAAPPSPTPEPVGGEKKAANEPPNVGNPSASPSGGKRTAEDAQGRERPDFGGGGDQIMSSSPGGIQAQNSNVTVIHPPPSSPKNANTKSE